ncbi:flavodoxin family protein [Paenibacillus sp. LMG 31460]|uniref:Flavodoxin family protein n=1 Tax=Paenibacillus germinis TaxID=2654979 RepID=A0ABX1YYJ5_9BACL|nr:NAD(P)H-dependent oxidoreductase [Paenibacillus germinis]NOU86200.1 flavodoxin family protein [Paenibacillus germinis]
MKTLLIGAHPNFSSFNAALRDAFADRLLAAGHEVKQTDLYEKSFQPVISYEELIGSFQGCEPPADVAKEHDDIRWADFIIFIYPTWWMGMPAIMKGYIDRVLSNNYAYRYGDSGRPVGLLTGKKALIVQTAGGSEYYLMNSGLEQAMKLITKEGIFGFCGIDVVEHLFLYQVNKVDDIARMMMLEQTAELISEHVR